MWKDFSDKSTFSNPHLNNSYQATANLNQKLFKTEALPLFLPQFPIRALSQLNSEINLYVFNSIMLRLVHNGSDLFPLIAVNRVV